MLPEFVREVEPSAQTSAVLDYQSAADRLQVSMRTVQRMVADGRLPTVSGIGRLVRIPASAIDDLLARAST